MDSSQIEKEKSTELVSKFGLDFELFYNVRNALNLLWPNQIMIFSIKLPSFILIWPSRLAEIKAFLQWCEEEEGQEEEQRPPQTQLRL